MQTVNLLALFTIVLFSVFTYGFVEGSVPLSVPYDFAQTIYESRLFTTAAYIFFITAGYVIYGFYLFQAYQNKSAIRKIVLALAIAAGILIVSYPAFSNDIYDYIATAKVTFLYRENPYIVMPIELSNEPMLSFMHAANKTALYGPVWILLTVVPHTIGMGNLFATVFAFKLFNMLFYFGTLRLLYLLSKKNVLSVVIFGLNPLVLIETFVSAHNDIVMIFFALLSFHLMRKKLVFSSVIALFLSIGIKYTTIVLVPLLVFVWHRQRTSQKIVWPHIWLSCSIALFAAMAVSPLREELYSWYMQWPLAFVSLIPQYMLLLIVSVFLSFGLSLRFAPYAYVREWRLWVPQAKTVITAISVFFGVAMYSLTKISIVKKAVKESVFKRKAL